ncbi:MAG: hypothetical protein EHM83_06860 [Burkholderiales bacterium]|nr:MAG: hypothetical protein EHM83_06860 [Burkholderiales bacterium]
MHVPVPPIALVLGLLAVPVAAETLSCPDLGGARQIAACPTEAELRYTFVGYCSDNARMYDRDPDACDDFEKYRKLKSIALWESAGGDFAAYASCDLAPEAFRAARPLRIAAERKGALTRLICDYAGGIRFVHRTRATCKVQGSGACDTPGNCRASCQ